MLLFSLQLYHIPIVTILEGGLIVKKLDLLNRILFTNSMLKLLYAGVIRIAHGCLEIVEATLHQSNQNCPRLFIAR